jgi:hypothetical protein
LPFCVVVRGRVELLVWANRPAAEASWIDDEEFKSLYPDFQLEDELLEKGGGGEMSCSMYNTPCAAASGRQR